MLWNVSWIAFFAVLCTAAWFFGWAGQVLWILRGIFCIGAFVLLLDGACDDFNRRRPAESLEALQRRRKLHEQRKTESILSGGILAATIFWAGLIADLLMVVPSIASREELMLEILQAPLIPVVLFLATLILMGWLLLVRFRKRVTDLLASVSKVTP